MTKVGKPELVKEIASELNLSQKEVQSVVDSLIEKIIDASKKEKEVVFLGFGKFKQRVNKERAGINPKTKEKIQIPESKTLSFKPSSKLKEIM